MDGAVVAIRIDMRRAVRLSTPLLLASLGVATPALADGPWSYDPYRPAAADSHASSPHPALVVGVADLIATGGLVPSGFSVGASVRDNGWEKASALIGAGLGLGALGTAATIHGADDGNRKLRDPVAAGFGWMFTSLAAGGVGSGIGLVIGGEEAGKPVGGVIAATSLIFLAPGIPLIADGERTAVPPAPAYSPPLPAQYAPGWGAPVSNAPPPPETEMNSPAMVGIGSTCIVIGGLGSFVGLAGLVAGGGEWGDGLQALGGGVLGASLGLVLAVGTPLVVVGGRRVPVAPQVTVGPGGLGLQGQF